MNNEQVLQTKPNSLRETEAYFLGMISVAAFAMTLPAAKYLITDFSALQIGIFRSFLAAMVALPILIFYKVKIPSRQQLKRLFLTSIGIIYGFPILTAVGMQYVPVSHGGVLLAALPISTAIFGALITGNRPSKKFWAVSLLGFLLILSYTIYKGQATTFYLGDLALFGAVILAGFGYAQGGSLSSELPGWQVMCWTLVISIPLLLPLSIWLYEPKVLSLSFESMFALGFLAFINSLLGFFSWNRALALGGISRISQLQLLQVFFTYGFAILFMGESWDWLTPIVCIMAVVLVWVSKRV
jgi:drug/metabolite transporter (DMT)-like permease